MDMCCASHMKESYKISLKQIHPVPPVYARLRACMHECVVCYYTYSRYHHSQSTVEYYHAMCCSVLHCDAVCRSVNAV